MDKRWIGILLIIIIACVCGYLVISSSNTVGNAITDVGKSTVTLPHGFSVKDDDSDSTTLFNKNSKAEIYIEDLGKKDQSLDCFNSEMKNLSSDKDIEIVKNTTNITDDFKLYSVFYTKGNETMSVSYIFKNNHTFLIKCSGFDDINDLADKINFIADNLEIDYKKSQD